MKISSIWPNLASLFVPDSMLKSSIDSNQILLFPILKAMSKVDHRQRH
jgi:hypothetical protein